MFAHLDAVVARAEYTPLTVGGISTERRLLIHVTARGMAQAVCGQCQSVTGALGADDFIQWVNSSIDLAAGRVGLAEARASSAVLFFEVGGLIIRRDAVALTASPSETPTRSTVADSTAPTVSPSVAPTSTFLAPTVATDQVGGESSGSAEPTDGSDNITFYIIIAAGALGLIAVVVIAVKCCCKGHDSRGSFSPDPGDQRDRLQMSLATPAGGLARHAGEQTTVSHPYFQTNMYATESPDDFGSPTGSSPGFGRLGATPQPAAQTKRTAETQFS